MSEQFIDVMVGMGLSRRAVLQLIAGACGAAALGTRAGGGRVETVHAVADVIPLTWPMTLGKVLGHAILVAGSKASAD